MTEQEYYKKLGEDVKALRESKGMKKVELAEKMEIQSSILSEFENEGKKLSAYRINQIMEILSGEAFPEKKTKLILKLQDSTPALSPA